MTWDEYKEKLANRGITTISNWGFDYSLYWSNGVFYFQLSAVLRNTGTSGVVIDFGDFRKMNIPIDTKYTSGHNYTVHVKTPCFYYYNNQATGNVVCRMLLYSDNFNVSEFSAQKPTCSANNTFEIYCRTFLV